MTGRVAIVTGGSQGIGAGLVAGYRARGWAVVASARTITPPEDPDVHRARAEVFEGRVAAEASIMSRGIFAWAASESRRRTDRSPR